jgi:hypothetical protein
LVAFTPSTRFLSIAIARDRAGIYGDNNRGTGRRFWRRPVFCLCGLLHVQVDPTVIATSIVVRGLARRRVRFAL